jgi:hypothetical protein
MGADQRLDVLEQRVDSNLQTQQRMEKKIDGIIETLHTLARIEERTAAASIQLAAMASDVRDQDKRLRSLEIAMPENLDKRLSSIETKLPQLLEVRGWVIAGVLGGLSLMGVASFKILFGA